MNISFGRSKAIRDLIADNQRLRKTQELLVDNILTVQEEETLYTGNRYKTYETAIVEVSNKYSGTANWGVIQVGNIIDLRAAYIIGQGIKVQAVEDKVADAELEFAERFIDKNELDHETVQDLAREAEIEGKILIKLFPITPAPVEGEPVPDLDIGLRWVSWTSNKYTVHVSKDDYLKIEKVTWQPTTGGGEKTLLPDAFVYKRFAGRLDVINETMPRVAKCLTQIENLDMALRDWRNINSKYAAPIPYFKCIDAEQAKKIQAELATVNWKVGKAFASTAEFDYKQPSAEGQAVLEAEIITLMKIISGTTGVPINALGCPELTTKYGADSQAMLDMISMSTSKEREIWRAAYQEILAKAMRMRNTIEKKTPLDPDKIMVEIPMHTKESWDRIISTWLPLFDHQAITLPTLLEQVPGLDVEAEIEAREAANEEEFKKAKALAEAQGKEDNFDEREPR